MCQKSAVTWQRGWNAGAAGYLRAGEMVSARIGINRVAGDGCAAGGAGEGDADATHPDRLELAGLSVQFGELVGKVFQHRAVDEAAVGGERPAIHETRLE